MKLEPKKIGPDICAMHANQRYWFEAIAPTSGAAISKDRIPEFRVTTPSVAQRVPVEKILLRFLSAISEKKRKFDEYRAKGIILR